MCGGQAIDLSMVGKKMTLEELRHMHALKTGTLLHAAVMSGIWCAKEESSSEELIEALSSYGNAVGLLFRLSMTFWTLSQAQRSLVKRPVKMH